MNGNLISRHPIWAARAQHWVLMWDRHLVGGTVADLHHRDLPLDRRGIWVMEATTPTLVLGSAQSDDTIDAESARQAGWAWTRRRTGGGLVALDPARVVWIDVVVPVDDPLWQADVGTAFAWLGDAWASAALYVAVLAVLSLRPQGLFGEPLGRRA